jgi:hypothetical protein
MHKGLADFWAIEQALLCPAADSTSAAICGPHHQAGNVLFERGLDGLSPDDVVHAINHHLHHGSCKAVWVS